jgi:hypothetical protein
MKKNKTVKKIPEKNIRNLDSKEPKMEKKKMPVKKGRK